MISLEEVKPFAEGGNRVCYIHPDNKNLCLKISKPEVVKKMRSNAPWYKKLRSERSFDDNYREESAYQQRAIKENPQKIWRHLAKWYEFVETSKGLASCTELITNNDKVALNLEEYLFSKGRTSEIDKALKEFEIFLKETKLLTKNLIPHNLAVKENDSELTLKIIDGLGCMSFITLQEISKTFEYIKDKEFTPKGDDLLKTKKYWDTLFTDKGAKFDQEFFFKGSEIDPMITFGTNPGMGMSITKSIPKAKDVDNGKLTYLTSLDYMGYKEGESMIGKPIDYVFIGSCTNGRIEDFRAFASIVSGRKRSKNVTAWLVPGSHKVMEAIKYEGLLEIFKDAEFELREPGCSACLAMNDDKIPPGKYAVSTSNRNFEGRQGPGARTLLASPLVAAAAAITGKITDPRSLI